MEVQIAEVCAEFDSASGLLEEVRKRYGLLKTKLRGISKKPLPKVRYLVGEIDDKVGMVEYYLKALDKNMDEIEKCVNIIKLVK